jgi:hypothetical protein
MAKNKHAVRDWRLRRVHPMGCSGLRCLHSTLAAIHAIHRIYVRPRQFLLSVLAAGVLFILTAVAVVPSSLNDLPAPLNLTIPESQRFPLEIIPPTISLGFLNANQPKRATVTLRNPGSEPIRVARIETSCPCIEVGPVPVLIGAGKTTEMVVSFDPSSEPGFRGALSVNIVGRESGGRTLFESHVDFGVGR